MSMSLCNTTVCVCVCVCVCLWVASYEIFTVSIAIVPFTSIGKKICAYLCVCVCACARACVCVCVCAYVCLVRWCTGVYGLCVLVCCNSHADVCSVIPIQIGNYRARDHFHQLVPQQELEQRVKEAEQAEGGDLVMWYFHALVDMMKKVFVEEHVLRPTAQDLLCEDVMLKGTHTHRMHTHTTSAHAPTHKHTTCAHTHTSHALTHTHHHCARMHHHHTLQQWKRDYGSYISLQLQISMMMRVKMKPTPAMRVFPSLGHLAICSHHWRGTVTFAGALNWTVLAFTIKYSYSLAPSCTPIPSIRAFTAGPCLLQTQCLVSSVHVYACVWFGVCTCMRMCACVRRSWCIHGHP